MVRPMWAILAALALGAAVLLAPDRMVEEGDSAPPPEAVTRVAALGRSHAAADVIWLRTVQLIGDPKAERRRWPSLEHWVDLTTRLDPAFATPYFFGAALLVGDPKRVAIADQLLERGQAAIPNDFSFPMMRGYIAYFGRLDPAGAAAQYRAASRLPGAPRYLEAFATRLETQAHNCTELLRNLSALAAAETPERRRAMLAEREPIAIGCVEGSLKNAAGAYRNRYGRDGTLEELRAEGLLSGQLYAPPGQCWKLSSGRPSLGPCATNEGRP